MKVYLNDNKLNRELCSELLGKPMAIGTKLNIIEVDIENNKWKTIFKIDKEIKVITNKDFLKIYANTRR